MRTYIKLVDPSGASTWQVIQTSPSGDNSLVWLVTLFNVLRLNLTESPLWQNYGIPSQESVLTRVFPDFYLTQIQQQFSPYFLSLAIQRTAGTTPPTYTVNVLLRSGAVLSAQVSQSGTRFLATPTGQAITTPSGQEIILP